VSSRCLVAHTLGRVVDGLPEASHPALSVLSLRFADLPAVLGAKPVPSKVYLYEREAETCRYRQAPTRAALFSRRGRLSDDERAQAIVANVDLAQHRPNAPSSCGFSVSLAACARQGGVRRVRRSRITSSTRGTGRRFFPFGFLDDEGPMAVPADVDFSQERFHGFDGVSQMALWARQGSVDGSVHSLAAGREGRRRRSSGEDIGT
jgi:hypothetical protein